MSFYNAFRNVIETKKYPHARAVRTSFRQKVADAFFTFAGSFFDRDHINHVGLFDYATLGIAYGLGELFFKATSIQNSIACAIASGILLLLNLPFVIARYAIAAVLTLVSLPIILAVHGFSLIEGMELEKKVLQVPIDVTQKKPHFCVRFDTQNLGRGNGLDVLWKDNQLHYAAVDFKGNDQKGCIQRSELEAQLGEVNCSKFVRELEHSNSKLNYEPKEFEPFLDGVLSILSKKGHVLTKDKSTIGDYLEAKHLTVEDLTVDVEISDAVTTAFEGGQNKELKLNFREQRVGASSGLGCGCCAGEHVDFSYTTVFNVGGINHPKNIDVVKQAFEPLLELNIGGVTAELEENYTNQIRL